MTGTELAVRNDVIVGFGVLVAVVGGAAFSRVVRRELSELLIGPWRRTEEPAPDAAEVLGREGDREALVLEAWTAWYTSDHWGDAGTTTYSVETEREAVLMIKEKVEGTAEGQGEGEIAP